MCDFCTLVTWSKLIGSDNFDFIIVTCVQDNICTYVHAYLANGAQERNRRGPVLNAAAAVSANPRAGRRMRRANVCEHNTYEHTIQPTVALSEYVQVVRLDVRDYYIQDGLKCRYIGVFTIGHFTGF